MNTRSRYPYQIIGFVILVIAGIPFLTGDYQTVGILIMAAGAAQIGSSVVLQSDSFKDQSKSTASSGILLILVGTIYQLVGMYHNDITVWLRSWSGLSPFNIGWWCGWLVIVSTVVLLAVVVFEWLKTASQSNQKGEQQGSNESNQTPESNKIPETPKTQNSFDHGLGLWVFFAVLVALAVLGIYLVQFHHHPLSNQAGDWGTFGDYVGGLLNPTFTFIMLVFVWHTFKRERNEVQHQKFEDRFFKLLELYQQTRQLKETEQGMCWIDEGLKPLLNPPSGKGRPNKNDNRPQKINDFFTKMIHESPRSDVTARKVEALECYSRVLLVILRFLENSHVDENTRNEFANILHTCLFVRDKSVLKHYCSYLLAENQQQEFCELVKKFLLRELR